MWMRTASGSGFIRHSDIEVVSARQPIAELQSHFHLAGGTTELEAGGERQYLVTWRTDVEVEGITMRQPRLSQTGTSAATLPPVNRTARAPSW